MAHLDSALLFAFVVIYNGSASNANFASDFKSKHAQILGSLHVQKCFINVFGGTSCGFSKKSSMDSSLGNVHVC